MGFMQPQEKIFFGKKAIKKLLNYFSMAKGASSYAFRTYLALSLAISSLIHADLTLKSVTF
jgi:hypothetical protein